MNDYGQLRDAISRIQQIGDRISTITETRSDSWRHELIRARRELSEAVARTFIAIGAFQAIDQAGFEGVRERLSVFRSALALHQASHPASSIANFREFKDSNDLVQRAGRDFIDAALKMLNRSNAKLP